MTGRLLAYCAAGVLVVIVGCSGILVAVFTGGSSAFACEAAPAPSGSSPAATASPGQVGRWDAEQTGYAATIIGVGMGKQVPARGWVIALATAMQESGLRNLGDLGAANDHDSLGLFQQRPSQGWGTPAQVMDPVYAAGKFYDKLLQVPNWQAMPVTVAAQAVQVSAYPDAYAKWEPDAQALASAVGSALARANPQDLEHCLSNCSQILSNGGTDQQKQPPSTTSLSAEHTPSDTGLLKNDRRVLPSPVLTAPDSAGQTAAIAQGSPEPTSALAGTAAIGTSCGAVISAQGWTQPVREEIVSPFGQRDGRLHAGVDLAAPKRTPIHAAASGVVRQVTCNAHTADGAPYSCDRDGSTSIGGCGWYVDIEHADAVITRYCHQIERPHVQLGQQVIAGQVIGLSGTSGHSSGPHLHYEVHLHGDSSNNGAVDPVTWMAAHGAPLGTS